MIRTGLAEAKIYLVTQRTLPAVFTRGADSRTGRVATRAVDTGVRRAGIAPNAHAVCGAAGLVWSTRGNRTQVNSYADLLRAGVAVLIRDDCGQGVASASESRSVNQTRSIRRCQRQRGPTLRRRKLQKVGQG